MKKNKKADEIAVSETKPKPVIPMDDDFGTDIVKNEPESFKIIEEPVEESVPVEYAIVKPVSGGLQPIIASKGQVQLNPVVVPVAFVPYATQNQPLLQEDIDEDDEDIELPDVKDQPLDKNAPKTKDKSPKFVSEGNEKKVSKKKLAVKSRIGNALLMILNIAFILFVILNHFADKMGMDANMILLRGTPDVLGGWLSFDSGNIKGAIPLFFITACTVIALANFITTFVGLCTARGYSIWISGILMLVLTLISTILSAIGVFGEDAKITFNPGEPNSIQWLLFFISVAIVMVGLIFKPQKYQISDED